MEAVPRLPMISFDLKVSPDRQCTDFSKLKQVSDKWLPSLPEVYCSYFNSSVVFGVFSLVSLSESSWQHLGSVSKIGPSPFV